ncbi:hypothetical protein JCGZ_19391 [Jatropha curcas]|uniref:DUF7722 domain-containing protein n=1 Tax=Jatropha curcas TaxID=180498 RepID=A0A067K2N9_JATCU|nr:hypothetical protein JCGZ_19391 [Jatropha curcas]
MQGSHGVVGYPCEKDVYGVIKMETYPSGGFQMPLHYPKYTKSDYEKMEEWRVDLLLREYGLNFKGTLEEKREFATGAFLWPVKSVLEEMLNSSPSNEEKNDSDHCWKKVKQNNQASTAQQFYDLDDPLGFNDVICDDGPCALPLDSMSSILGPASYDLPFITSKDLNENHPLKESSIGHYERKQQDAYQTKKVVMILMKCLHFMVTILCQLSP